MNKIEHLFSIQQNIYENIRFADSKAMAITAINLAVIAGLNVIAVFDKTKFELFTVGLLSFLALSTSIIFSVQVLRPRGYKSKNASSGHLCDPLKITNIDCDSYINEVANIDDSTLSMDIAVFIYDRSVINNEKYKWLKLEIWMSMIGWGLALLAAFLQNFA